MVVKGWTRWIFSRLVPHSTLISNSSIWRAFNTVVKCSLYMVWAHTWYTSIDPQSRISFRWRLEAWYNTLILTNQTYMIWIRADDRSINGNWCLSWCATYKRQTMLPLCSLWSLICYWKIIGTRTRTGLLLFWMLRLYIRLTTKKFFKCFFRVGLEWHSTTSALEHAWLFALVTQPNLLTWIINQRSDSILYKYFSFNFTLTEADAFIFLLCRCSCITDTFEVLLIQQILYQLFIFETIAISTIFIWDWRCCTIIFML